MAPSPLSPNAIIRGIQLALLGAYRALQNPTFLSAAYLKLAAISIVSGILLSLILSVPVKLIQLLVWGTASAESYVRREKVLVGVVGFVENQVLQMPMVVMGLLQHIGGVGDDLFMKSVQFADEQYLQNHADDDPKTLRPLHYPTLSQYTPSSSKVSSSKEKKPKQRKSDRLEAYFYRTSKRLGVQLLLYFASYLPYLGTYISPAYTLYLLYPSLGPTTLLLTPILALPRQHSTILLSVYLASRTLTRELLEPYFRRLPFTPDQKRRWFRDRESVLLGVGLAWTILMRQAGWAKVLVYAGATAGMGVVITKITTPPPAPVVGSTQKKEEVEKWCEEECRWKNKNLFFRPVRFLKDFEEIAGEEIKKLEKLTEEMEERKGK